MNAKRVVLFLLIISTLINFSCISKKKTNKSNKSTTKIISTVTLDADGPGGQETYSLIESVFGTGCLEVPDLYPPDKNHTGFKHVQEETDGVVGNHFVFYIHRDLDWDRNKGHSNNRQRNEIKVYDNSDENLKGKKNETFIYKWKFKINKGMTVSNKFSHFFQLKAVGGDEGHPLLTISGAKKGGNDFFEVRHSPSKGDTILDYYSWDKAKGVWLEAYCKVKYSDNGLLELEIKKLDGTVVLSIDKKNIDMWRDGDYIRPKWGIYRSLKDKDNLRKDEETVRFANFSISKVK